MTRQEFLNHMNRIIDCYSDKSYPDIRVQQIWKWAQHMDGGAFLAVVEGLIEECERAPMLPKFKEVYSAIRVKSPPKRFECYFCNGEGWVLNHDDPAPLPSAYACRCPVGQRMPTYVKRWEGQMKRMVPTPAELAWNKSAQIVKETITEKGIEI